MFDRTPELTAADRQAHRQKRRLNRLQRISFSFKSPPTAKTHDGSNPTEGGVGPSFGPQLVYLWTAFGAHRSCSSGPGTTATRLHSINMRVMRCRMHFCSADLLSNAKSGRLENKHYAHE